MLIPDVLALPLAEAIARLETAEIGYTVADTQPPRRQNEVVAEKIAVEYVVRQSLLSDNKVALVTVKKYRKEVLENGYTFVVADLPFSQQKQDGPPVAVISGMKFGIQSSFCATDETWRIPFLSRIAAVR
mgnify:CR=1 FL=1